RKPSKWSFDSKIKGEIDTYITISDKMFGKIASKMDALGYSYPVALLGIGQLAFKLMKTKAFATNPRLKFFDNNASIAGNSIYNTTILHGSQIVAEYLVEPFTIVITSLIHERPIREGIMKRFAEQGIQPPNVMGFSEIMEDVEI
ncbi:MAG: hypothetical protein EBZ77_01460, partial [Chitinophagia bacterium]|nr:hypothetical protein [Chitinophagia bacterium]